MFVLIILCGLLCLYLYGKRNHDYWGKRGIKYEKPMLFFGGSIKQLTEKVSYSQRFANLYNQYPDEKFVGFFEGNQQGLLIRDSEIIKTVLQTDFQHFHYRGFNYHKEVTEPLMYNLFQVDGDVWKLLRQKLTPMFSSGKLKAMFPLITERAERLEKRVDGLASTSEEVDTRELMARYTTDVIGACGFGIDADTMNNEMSDFRKLGKRIIFIKPREVIINILKRVAPGLFKHIHFFSQEVEAPTIQLVTHIMRQRDYKPIGRNDFIDLLLKLRANGKIVGESLVKHNSERKFELELDDKMIAAQVFVFYAAGFETSSSASSFLLHLLAYHPEEQARCQENIDEVLKNHDGKLTFDAIKEMKYLEMALLEALRILPSPGFLLRKNVSKYTFPGTNLTIDPETYIQISIQGLHHDPNNFEDPEEFRPERFHPNKIGDIKKFTYMPFGEGPRSCVGERMGIMQSMAGVAAILSKFSVAPSKNSIRKPRIAIKSTIVEVIEEGLPLTLKRR